MVFKTVSGITEDPFDAYNSAHVIAEEEMSALDVTNNYAGNYKNRIVLNWNNVRPTEVKKLISTFSRSLFFLLSFQVCFPLTLLASGDLFQEN